MKIAKKQLVAVTAMAAIVAGSVVATIHIVRRKRTRAALAALRPIEAWGAARDQKNIARSAAMVNAFFAQTEKIGVPKYATDALGFWHDAFWATEDHMFWSDGNNYAQYQARVFRKDLFTGRQLKQIILAAVAMYYQGREATENKMLVRIEQGIPALAANDGTVNPSGKKRFAALYAAALARSRSAVGPAFDQDLAEAIATNAVAWAGGYLAEQAAAAGAGAAIAALGFGAAGTPETDGISTVAGLLAAAGIYGADEIWGGAAGRQAKVEALARGVLEKLRLEVLNGTAGRLGLVAILRKSEARWQATRNEAFRKAIIKYEAQHG